MVQSRSNVDIFKSFYAGIEHSGKHSFCLKDQRSISGNVYHPVILLWAYFSIFSLTDIPYLDSLILVHTDFLQKS